MQILMITFVLIALAWAYWTGRTVADWRVSDDDPQRRAWRVWVWPATTVVWAFLTSSHKTAAAINKRLPGGWPFAKECETAELVDALPVYDEDIPL